MLIASRSFYRHAVRSTVIVFRLTDPPQLDMEMAFANGKGVMHRIEDLIAALWYWRSRNWPGSSPELRKPFLRMTYDEAMKKHGVDKPDLRIKDLVRLFVCFKMRIY